MNPSIRIAECLRLGINFRRILRLAESVPGRALYMMHVSAATGVAAISEARRKRLPIYGETLHQYLLYTYITPIRR